MKTKIEINKKIWKINDVKKIHVGKRTWGICYFDDRLIEIDENLNSKKRLNTIIHEMTHAKFPDMKHNKVEDFADIVAKILWRDGWRKGQ